MKRTMTVASRTGKTEDFMRKTYAFLLDLKTLHFYRTFIFKQQYEITNFWVVWERDANLQVILVSVQNSLS